MSGQFDYFVVFAEMRTGSNFLEANLNAFDDIACLGEAFNPHFIGYPNKEDVLGVTYEERQNDPLVLVDKVKDQSGVAGFRYFHDHEPRVLEHLLDDPRCAKIILTRNPAESYVSWKIAQETGQWKLTNVKNRKAAAATFDRAEFFAHLEALQSFQITLLNGLQARGQTAFYVAYEDLQNLDVINGLAKYLGSAHLLETLDRSLKPQNPTALSAKVENYDDMVAALADLDTFNLSRTPNFEPRRNPAIPSYVAAAQAPVLFMPMKSAPHNAVLNWLAELDHTTTEDLRQGFTQKTLRQWKRKTGAHRSFTVLRHPVARAYHAFCDKIVRDGEGSYSQIRQFLKKNYKMDMPQNTAPENYDLDRHRAAFKVFLRFLGENLAGQTSIRIDPHWATQQAVIQGFGEFSLPDVVIREDEMAAYLPALALQLGLAIAPDVTPEHLQAPYDLSDVYDAEVETLVHDAYQKDYVMFGFGPFR